MHQLEANIVFEESLYRIEGKVVVILDKTWSGLGEQDVTLLSKILSSVGQDISGVTILTSPVDINQVAQTFAPSAIVSFDTRSGNESELYQLTKINTAAVLMADSLGQLNEEKKRALWEALKQIFRT